MPRCVTNIPRSEFYDRPSPLTCRHRRRCACENGQVEQGQSAHTRSVSAQPAPSVKPWENESARAMMRSLDPYPEAKAAFIAAIMEQYKDEP